MIIKESETLDKISSFIKSTRGIIITVILLSISFVSYLIYLANLDSKKVELETSRILNEERLKESKIASKKFYIMNEGILFSPNDYEYMRIDGTGMVLLNTDNRDPSKSINLDKIKLVEFFEVKNIGSLNHRLKKDLTEAECKIKSLVDENKILSEKNRYLSSKVSNYENMMQLKNSEINNKNIEIEKYKNQEKIFNKILAAIKKNKTVTNINDLIVSNDVIQSKNQTTKINTNENIKSKEKTNEPTKEELIIEINSKLTIVHALNLANTKPNEWDGKLSSTTFKKNDLHNINIDKLSLMTLSLDRSISILSSRLETLSAFSKKHIDGEINKLKFKPL